MNMDGLFTNIEIISGVCKKPKYCDEMSGILIDIEEKITEWRKSHTFPYSEKALSNAFPNKRLRFQSNEVECINGILLPLLDVISDMNYDRQKYLGK